ncbi:hypothetical protein AXG93_3228s1220 [Marchantia polymorpha subsp. ruderalis]|uniref:Uncharacterized protein n=1 Tax=Marchantia polymorpha subsp. ruderalis TaxID=1480154 RepID=A0A176WJS8_MARPO|nr:hypothetical protein AXG93_3228s1220 [Marchantia polymorpha subsp. ruderalis]
MVAAAGSVRVCVFERRPADDQANMDRPSMALAESATAREIDGRRTVSPGRCAIRASIDGSGDENPGEGRLVCGKDGNSTELAIYLETE